VLQSLYFEINACGSGKKIPSFVEKPDIDVVGRASKSLEPVDFAIKLVGLSATKIRG
jgi:hypothetical protein